MIIPCLWVTTSIPSLMRSGRTIDRGGQKITKKTFQGPYFLHHLQHPSFSTAITKFTSNDHFVFSADFSCEFPRSGVNPELLDYKNTPIDNPLSIIHMHTLFPFQKTSTANLTPVQGRVGSGGGSGGQVHTGLHSLHWLKDPLVAPLFGWRLKAPSYIPIIG